MRKYQSCYSNARLLTPSSKGHKEAWNEHIKFVLLLN